MNIEYKECATCGGFVTSWRGGECLTCRPAETINLAGTSVMPQMLAMIGTHLEVWGKVTVVGAALSYFPGAAALRLGIEVCKEEWRRSEGWDINHSIVCYLLGVLDGCSDAQEVHDLVEAVRVVTMRMVELG